MQGTFAGADWDSALDPGVDDEAQRQQRSDQIERELEILTRLRNNQPIPVQPDPLRYTQVFPPTPHFKLDGKTFYILKSNLLLDVEAQHGEHGQYLVTTTDIVENPGYARPMDVKMALPVHQQENPDGPGMKLGDHRNRPDPRYCIEEIHFIVPGHPAYPPPYYEIGLKILKDTLERAEALDLAFARRMEGLGNVAAKVPPLLRAWVTKFPSHPNFFQVCWDCLDPDFDPSDRRAVMDQFMAKYLGRFYSGVDPETGPATNLVADEALHKHKAFCLAWAKKHYKTLTPAVTAPAESLTAEFYPYIEPWFSPGQAKLTHPELARVLMRFEPVASEFATCLHFYGTSLEQARGGRNASYKQMSTVSTYRAISHKRFGDLLAAKTQELQALFALLGSSMHHRLFHPVIVDWHAILGQMPQTHRYFQNDSLVQGLLRTTVRPNRGDAAHVPPWRTMRNTGP